MMSLNHKHKKIEILPQSVANRIAAGEVVERPAAVVKELIENALDAEASHITVVIKDAGRTLIRVVDDGTGMTDTDLAIAIGRHATSKLQRIEDLESLSTFGFRGEALPSIAAVSRLEIVSRTRDNDVGTVLKVSGGQVDQCEPTSSESGTTISISHLFYNVPARRKFLRSDSTEYKWIATVFRQFALAFPEVSWELYRDDDRMYSLPANSPRERIAGMFGDDIGEDLIQIEHQRDWLKIGGFISPPSLTQRTRMDQYLFLNRRPITSPHLVRAVYNACESYITTGGHPIFIIMLQAPPDSFDINVHPAKKEVKFADERGAASGVWAAVRNAITKARSPDEFLNLKSSDTGIRGVGVETTGGKATDTTPETKRLEINAPDHLTPFISVPRKHKEPYGDPLPFSQGPNKSTVVPADERSFDPSIPEPYSDPVNTGEEGSNDPVIWQVFNTFLVSQLKTGLVFIDQHIAHERILYEMALQSMNAKPWTSQQLLFPAIMKIRQEDAPLVEETMPLLRAMGFQLEQSSPFEYRIIATPTGIRIHDEAETLVGIIEEYRESANTSEDPRHRLASAFACRAAVKAGQPLEMAEMQRLIERLFQTEDPEFCPHGRPIYHVLSRRDIEKWFKR